MNISFLHKPLGCLLFILLLFVLAGTIVSCAVDVVQVNIIKRFSPDYTTWAETAREKKEERQKIAEEEAKRQKEEIAIEIDEDLKEQQMSTLIDTRKIENSLKKKGHNFSVLNFYALDSFVWVYGELLTKKIGDKDGYFCPAIVISEDGGNDYKLSKVLEELGRIGGTTSASSMMFSEKSNGWLSIYTHDGYFEIYKTNDGGYNWDTILNTKNISLTGSYVRRIRVRGQNIYLIMSFQTEGSFDLMESNDYGKSWTYKHGDRGVAKTFDKGTTWEVVKKGG